MLGVPKESDAKAIRDAFRELALKYHPDRNRDPGSEDRFREIAQAYAVLSDPQKRAEYDRKGSGFPAGDFFGKMDFGDLFEGFPGGFFEGLFHRNRGEDIEVTLEVPLWRIAKGGKEKVVVPVDSACPDCGGSGAAPGTSPKTCQACGGTGRKSTRKKWSENEIVIEQVGPCPDCGGTGRIIEKPCPACGGKGRVRREETLEVSIPPGIGEGSILRIQGKGMPYPGGAPGDLYVVVKSAKDPRFERDGADLWCAETISLIDAVLGTKIRVPTLDRPAEVDIPPGTQPDAVLRIRGKGLPGGDLYLRIRILVPEKLSGMERDLYRKLREISAGGS